MPQFCIIGSSTLLQKSLPHFAQLFPNAIKIVFLDAINDHEAIKFCESNQILYSDVSELKNGNIQPLKDIEFDYLFNINSTVILSLEQLSIAKIANLNLHPGKLPAYAGLHTHQWAIRNGEKEFGVTLHYMEAGLDTGNIALSSNFFLTEKETGLSLYLKCMQEGAVLVKEALEIISSGKNLPVIPQDHANRKLYTAKMAATAYIDFEGTAIAALRLIRAADYAPFQSPTYTPLAICNGDTLVFTKAEIILDYPHFLGQFYFDPNKGLYIRFNDGVLMVTKIKTASGNKAETDYLMQLFS